MSDNSCLVLVGFVALLLSPTTMAEEQLGDPTRPSRIADKAQQPVASGPSWEIESIIVSPGRRLAVVNGRTVGINDWVGGARVLEILPYEVRLEYKGEVRNVALIPIRVKNPATRVVKK